MKKRLLSLVLCLVMVFSLFPAFGMNALAADYTLEYSSNGTNTIEVTGEKTILLRVQRTWAAHSWVSENQAVVSLTNEDSREITVTTHPASTKQTVRVTDTSNGTNYVFTIVVNPDSSTPDDPTPGTGGYQIAYNGLQVGDQIDMSRQYYIKDGNEYKPVQITNAQYFTEQTQGWTVQTGVGKYYLPADASTGTPDSFRLVSNGTGDLYTPHSDLKYRTVINTEYLKSLTWYYGIPTDYYYLYDGTFQKVYGEWQGKAARFHGKLYRYVGPDGQESTAAYIATRGNTGDDPSEWTAVADNYKEIETSSAFIYGGNPNVGVTLYTKDQGANSLTYVDAAGVTHTIGDVLTVNDPTQVLYTGPLYDKSTDYGATKIVYTNGATIGEDYKEGTVLTNQPLYWFDPTGQTDTVTPNHYDSDPNLGILLDENTNFDGNLFLKKGLYFDQTSGEYGIKLESWATGTMSKSGGGGPMDVILVVDLSHSMKEDGTSFTINGEHRIKYVREAIEDFIDTMYDANQAGGDIRLAITSFSNKLSDQSSNSDVKKYPLGLYDGGTFIRMKSATTANYQSALKKVDDTGKTQLLASLQTDPFQDPQGNGTYPEDGMKLAINILANRDTANQNRKPVVVFFTDGWTGTDTQSASKYAETALERSNTLKASKAQGGYDATIYSIGVFHFDDARTDHMHYQYDTDEPNITVKNYMEHMSSMYNTTTLETIQYKNDGVTRRTDGARRITNNTPDNTDQTYYFRIRTGTGAVNPLQELNDAFGAIAETIAETDVNANADSVLGDVINTNNLSIAGAQMKATTVTADDIDAYKNIHWTEVEGEDKEDEQPLVANQNWTDLNSATVGVSGFDYTKTFTAYNENGQHNLGKKLIVRIKGLTPEKGGIDLLSNTEAGIYTNAGDEEPFLSVDSPDYTIPTKTMVIDFNAPMNLSPVAGRLKKQTNNNGSFELDENTHTLTYQLGYKNGEKLSKGADISLSGTDSALAYVVRSFDSNMAVSAKGAELRTDSGWTNYIAVPASSVYFDDELLEAQAVDIGTGSSYNDGIDTSAAASIGATAQGGNIEITFTGSRIDAYCTTTAEGKSVTANLKDLAGTILTDKNGKKCNVTMKNQSANESRQNVPTVSFDMGDKRVGKYVLTLKDYYNGDYKLDGIRVYHPVGVNTDETALYTVTKDPDTNAVIDSELNARFVNLRALLADNLQDQVAAHEADVQEHADDPDYVEHELGTIAFFTDKGGTPTISDYVKDGPKNEIYLDHGESIAFSIMHYDQYNTGDNHGKVMIGLSVQGDTAGEVTINNDTANPQTVSSKTDMYYKINPTLDGTKGQVIIKNTGDVKIAITNLKVTGVLSLTPEIKEIGPSVLAVNDTLNASSTTAVPEAFVEPSLSINRSLLSFAQNPYPAETTDDTGTTDPEPTHTPLQELVVQLISNFVKALFNSIARLFGN